MYGYKGENALTSEEAKSDAIGKAWCTNLTKNPAQENVALARWQRILGMPKKNKKGISTASANTRNLVER